MADRGVAGPRIAKLGRYEVVSELGKGAMGIVYLARDPVIGRMVAIKTIRVNAGGDEEDTQEFRERFVREAQTAGILSHPNIVTIHDIGEDPETQVSFIAMEYIEGKNLKMLLGEKTRFPYDQVSEIVAEVAEALDYAHRKGIIHRDVKPANIIITTDGKVKITDFGIAKIASSNLTTTGQFLGTPNYMSPEQVSGSPVDGRSDLFSLGVVLYELLTSRKPFQGDNLTAISYKIVHEDHTPPADLSPEIPHEFNDIVGRAMAKDPWNRYQRGKDLALALYQLKAQLDERRSQEDLGTMISAAAESVPTLKLANLLRTRSLHLSTLAQLQESHDPWEGAPTESRLRSQEEFASRLDARRAERLAEQLKEARDPSRFPGAARAERRRRRFLPSRSSRPSRRARPRLRGPRRRCRCGRSRARSRSPGPAGSSAWRRSSRSPSPATSSFAVRLRRLQPPLPRPPRQARPRNGPKPGPCRSRWTKASACSKPESTKRA